jgi:predicted regulator of Ras-like GTPase activity (Roadblock/LC7/MglB family)
MTNKKMIDLQTLVEETGAESGLSFNIDGILNKSVNLEYDGNVAAMIGMILKMCLEMSEDVNNGDLKQVMIKNNDGIVVASKNQDDNCIALLSKDLSKMGLLLRRMDSIFNN